MESQKDYETYVVQNIARDIESLDPDRKVDSIRIEGEMPYSPQVENSLYRLSVSGNVVRVEFR